MKRSRSSTMSFIDAQHRSSRAGRHRAALYGNSVGWKILNRMVSGLVPEMQTYYMLSQ